MQQLNVAFLATYELTLSLIFAMVTIWLATKFMNKFVLSKPIDWFIREKHAPGCVISGALIFSVLYLARGSVEHSTMALQTLMMAHRGIDIACIMISLLYFISFYIISFLAAFIFIFLVNKIYRRMMQEIDFDHHVEIQRNMALSAFLSIILIGVIVFVDKPFNHFLGSLVFYEYLDTL